MYTCACVLISGGMTSRPRTMPITCSPSPTPGSTQRTLGTGSVGSTMGRPPYTTGHHYSGAPISTTAPYSANMGIGSSGMGTHYSSGVAPTSSYGGVPTQGGYAGGRGMQLRQMYSSGQGQSGMYDVMYDQVCYMYVYMDY